MRTLLEVHRNGAVLSARPGGAAAYLATPLLGCVALTGLLFAENAWLSTCLVALPIGLALSCVRPTRRRVSWDPSARLRLEALNEGEDPSYRVVLMRNDSEEILLEHPTLEIVLRDLSRIIEASSLEVQPSAVVPTGFLRRTDVVVPRFREPSTTLGVASASQQRAARAVLGAGLFVLIVFAWSAFKGASEVGWLSAALPSLGAGLLFLLGACLASERTQVRVGNDGLVAEKQGLFARHRRMLTIPAHELAGAHVVEHGEVAVQVVFATARGPRVLPLLGDAARRVARAVGQLQGSFEENVPELDASELEARSGTVTRGPRDRRVSREVVRRRETRKNA